MEQPGLEPVSIQDTGATGGGLTCPQYCSQHVYILPAKLKRGWERNKENGREKVTFQQAE